jgi:hypothetical protein
MAIRTYYRVDFYEGSAAPGKSVFSLEPANTPYVFAVGDFVDPSGWTGNPLPADQHYQITAIEHQLTYAGGDECQHAVAVLLKAVARN